MAYSLLKQKDENKVCWLISIVLAANIFIFILFYEQ
jgi:hypothetical protein